MKENWLKISDHRIILASVLGMILSAFFLFPATGHTKKSPASAPAKELSYPLDQFSDGKARHFQYKTANGKTIRFFIVRSSDGVIRAAFDACDVCWPSGKGYQQDGEFMICRNCKKKFLISQVNVVTGGCNPAALNRQVTKTEVILQVKEILEGNRYFNF